MNIRSEDLPWWADFSGHRMVTAGEIVDESPDVLVADAVAAIKRAEAREVQT